jgi:D-3-phosphoglycerate dehydrogenase
MNNFIPKDITVLVIRLSININKKFLTKFNNLKYIISPTTGLNHIDMDYCFRNKIEIISLKGEYKFLQQINATPEYTFSLLLIMIKNIYTASVDVRNHGIKKLDRLNYLSREFGELKIGIAGFGRVGKKIYQYCKNLNMEVLLYDPYLKQDEITKYSVLKETHLSQFLNSIDVLIICISYSKDNENYFSLNRLKQLKTNVILINTSRGEVLDENAVIDLLLEGKISSAALDVLSIENKKDTLLYKKIMNYLKLKNNLLITHHIAGATLRSMHLTELFTANKFKSINLKYEKNINSN